MWLTEEYGLSSVALEWDKALADPFCRVLRDSARLTEVGHWFSQPILISSLSGTLWTYIILVWSSPGTPSMAWVVLGALGASVVSFMMSWWHQWCDPNCKTRSITILSMLTSFEPTNCNSIHSHRSIIPVINDIGMTHGYISDITYFASKFWTCIRAIL